jgi:hypothetical protein
LCQFLLNRDGRHIIFFANPIPQVTAAMVGHTSAKEHQRAAGQFKEHKYTTNPNQ